MILSSVAYMSSCVCTLASKLSARALQSVMSCSSFDADCSFDADDSGISDVHSSESSSDSALLYACQHDLPPDPAELYSESDVDLLRDSASFEALPVPHVSEDAKQKVAAPKPKLYSKPKHKLRMIDEDKDGVRIKILPSPRAQFRRRMQQTSILGDDFFVPNRAQLLLDFLKKHGDRIVKEKLGPKKRFSSTLKLVQYVL